MTSATPPVLGYSFTSFQSSQPNAPLPADKIEQELNRGFSAVGQIIADLNVIQEPDGTLKTNTVGLDQLEDGILDTFIADLQQSVADDKAQAQSAASTATNAKTAAEAARDQAQTYEANAGTDASSAAASAAAASAARIAAESAQAAAEAAKSSAQASASTATSAQNNARLAEDMSFRWAEEMNGPVVQLEPGHSYPGTVDDGLFSAKWWALTAAATVELGGSSDPEAGVKNLLIASDYDAADLPYDNTASGLTAVNVQAAIDEAEGRLDAIEADYLVSADLSPYLRDDQAEQITTPNSATVLTLERGSASSLQLALRFLADDGVGGTNSGYLGLKTDGSLGWGGSANMGLNATVWTDANLTGLSQLTDDVGYLQLTGGTLTGNLTIEQATSPVLLVHRQDLTDLVLGLSVDSAGNPYVGTFNDAGAYLQTRAIFQPDGTAITNDNAVVTREKGDARYGRNVAAGGSIDLDDLTASGFYRVEAGLTNDAPTSLSYSPILVVHGAGDTIFQMGVRYGDGRQFVRGGNPPDVGGTGTWTGWYEVAHLERANSWSAEQTFNGNIKIENGSPNIYLKDNSGGQMDGYKLAINPDDGTTVWWGDFGIEQYDDAGTLVGLPFRIDDAGGAYFDSIRIPTSGDASLAGTTHAFQIGDTAGANLIMDQNELMARTNGGASTLYLNNDGGNVHHGATITAASDITAYSSDERLKDNIQPIGNALRKLDALGGYTFDWNDKADEIGFQYRFKHEHGVLAQEVQKVVPDAVTPAPFNEKYLTVKYDRLVPLLIQAVKELKVAVEQLKEAA